MVKRQEKLAQKRQALLLKIQAQRSLVTIYGTEIRQSLSLVDMASELFGKMGNSARRRPIASLLITAVVMILKPARAFAVARSALMGWQIWQSLSSLVKHLRQSRDKPAA
ncbi:YqjK family protein [Undibacterium sp. Ji49W]|uniref:YqjK family protein n=1 Tax=Undibacterium sp. Ji49W TaxID=3413040 RepID=UPI003BF11833